ncbi:MAG TPA: PAS domain-containing protein [Longimicrobiales bacterium]|nr:PAS domain-containing protein [Longimicrobiales bacterium]
MTDFGREDATLVRIAVEAAALPFCVLDAAGVVRFATAAWQQHAPGASAFRAGGGFNYLKSLQHLAEGGTAHARLLHDGIAAVLAARTPRFRLEHPAAHGERRQVLEATALPGGGAVVTHLDVTSAHAAEMRYRRLLQRYRAVTANGRVGVWEIDPARRRINVDGSLCLLLGYPDGGERDWSEWRARLHPEDVAAVEGQWGRCAPAGEPGVPGSRIGPFEVRVADTRGGYRTFECTGDVVRDRQGAVITVHGTLHDVSERRAAQEAMLRSNRHLQELAERLSRLEQDSESGI